MKNCFLQKLSIISVVLVAALALALVSCGGGDGNNNTPGGGGAGYLTITDIPLTYNGQYIYFHGEWPLYGCQSVEWTVAREEGTTTYSNETYRCIQIINGRAVLPMWRIDNTQFPVSFNRFNGSMIREGVFHIVSSPVVTLIPDNFWAIPGRIAYIESYPIVFTNGGAAVSANDCTIQTVR